jgi:hypothetical protein
MSELTANQKKLLRWHEFKREILEENHICTTDCKYYHKCPLAVSDLMKRKERECRVKSLSDDDLNRFLTFFVFEQDVLKDEALRVLFRMGQILELKKDAREMQIYLDNMLKIIRAFHLDVNSTAGLDEPISINIKDFGVDVDQFEPANKAFREEGMVLQEDPESLVHSATLIEKFMTPPSQTSELRKRAIFVPKDELVRVKL